MPVKVTGPGEVNEIDRFEGGFGWLAHPQETMERASHALETDAGVYLVDPLDAAGLDDALADLGPVTGVVVLLEQHGRHAARLAARHDVPVYLPEWLRLDPDAPVERFDDRLPGTDVELHPVLVTRLWREGALWDGETLYVPESVGAAPYFLAPGERVGVSHMRRFWPPREALGDLEPDRLLLGHGEGVLADADSVLAAAIENARPSAWRFYRANFPTYVRTLWAAMTRGA